jgi:hypothetical protein
MSVNSIITMIAAKELKHGRLSHKLTVSVSGGVRGGAG